MSEVTLETLQKAVEDMTSEFKKFDSRLVDLEVAVKQLDGNDSQFEKAFQHLRMAMEQYERQANNNSVTAEGIICWLAGYQPGDYKKDMTMQALDPDAPKNEPALRPRNDFDKTKFFELLREIGQLMYERREQQIREYMAQLEKKAKQKDGIILPNGQKLEIKEETETAEAAPSTPPTLTVVK